MEITPREVANKLNEIVKQIKAGFDETNSAIVQSDAEALDLTHAFELLGPEEIDPTELLWQYQDNRRERRRAKDENEQWRMLYEIVSRLGLLDESAQAKRGVQAIIKTQHVRRYTVKTRTDLQRLFDQAKMRTAKSQNVPETNETAV